MTANNDVGTDNNLFSTGKLNILHCKFKCATSVKWKGHLFYLQILRSFERLIDFNPRTIEEIYGIPLWFNKTLNTKFDGSAAHKGFNYIRDLFPQNKKITVANLINLGCNQVLIDKIIQILNKVPYNWLSTI